MSVTLPPGREAGTLVLAKAAVAGRSKTRLARAVGADAAAALQQAMLLDTLDCCRAEVPDTGVLVEDTADVAAVRALVPAGTSISVQRGRGLADALRSGAAAALAKRGPVALVASDLPGLPPGTLAAAFERLRTGIDVVIGPGFDGGYWLIALGAAHTAPFRDIPWSTPDVLETTLARCREASLAVALAEPWRDLDTLEDLEALAREADTLPGTRTAGLLSMYAGSPMSITSNPRPTDSEEVPAR